MISNTAATVAESSVAWRRFRGGRRRVGDTVCRRRGVLTDLQQLVRRDAALGHQVHQRREVVHVDRSDVGDQTLALLGGQSHVGEDVHSGGGSGRRRLGRAIRLAAKAAPPARPTRATAARDEAIKVLRMAANRSRVIAAPRRAESPPLCDHNRSSVPGREDRISLPGDHRLGSVRLVRRRGGLHRLPRRPRPRLPLVVGAGVARPGGRRRRPRIAVLGRERSVVARLLQPARQRQHRPPAPQARGGDQGAGRQAVHGRPDPRQRRPQRGGPADRRVGARATRTRCSSPTAAPRPPRTPSAWRAATPGGTRC